MKKYLVLVSLIAVASTFVLLTTGTRNADETVEEAADDGTINFLGV